MKLVIKKLVPKIILDKKNVFPPIDISFKQKMDTLKFTDVLLNSGNNVCDFFRFFDAPENVWQQIFTNKQIFKDRRSRNFFLETMTIEEIALKIASYSIQ